MGSKKDMKGSTFKGGEPKRRPRSKNCRKSAFRNDTEVEYAAIIGSTRKVHTPRGIGRSKN